MHKTASTLAAFCCLLSAVQAAPRAWTDDTGRKVEAEYIRIQGPDVLLKLHNGETVHVPLTKLSPQDQQFIHTQHRTAPSQAPKAWPKKVEAPGRAINITLTAESPAARRYIYQSEAFEFTSQAKLANSVMKEVAQTFEATRALVQALPWGIQIRPIKGQTRFQASLYETTQDYLDAGGMADSAGVYNTKAKLFQIPFASLGLEKRGQSYFKNDRFDNHTLIHEVTHQLMDDYLPLLPMWIIEGSAEYTSSLPYKAGVFHAEAHLAAIKNALITWEKEDGYKPDLGDLKTHLTMTQAQWQAAAKTPAQMRALYHKSQLLVYYFCHLDGDQKGTRFIRFLNAVNEEVTARRTFFDHPEVKVQESGKISHPATIQAPDLTETVVFKHLPILLDGRSYEQLASDVQAAYQSIGIQIQ